MTETTTETVRDEQALLKAYREAVEDLKSLRDENKNLKAELEKKPKDENEWKDRALKAEVQAELAKTGVKDVGRLVKYVGTDGIDFDENGNLTGLSDKLEQVKKDLPELFDAKRRVGGKADIFTKEPAEEESDNPIREGVRAALGRS